MRTRASAAAIAAFSAAGLLAGCGSSSSQPSPTWHNLSIKVPPSIIGFTVQPEPKSQSVLKSGGSNSLLTGGQVYSMRLATELYAVLEIAELKPNAREDNADYQQQIVGQIGQSVPRPLKLEGRTVYEGTAPNQQSIYVWFNSNRMYVMVVHNLPKPRLLATETLKVVT